MITCDGICKECKLGIPQANLICTNQWSTCSGSCKNCEYSELRITRYICTVQRRPSGKSIKDIIEEE